MDDLSGVSLVLELVLPVNVPDDLVEPDILDEQFRAASRSFSLAVEAEIQRWLDGGFALGALVVEYWRGEPRVEKTLQQEWKITQRFRVREKTEREKEEEWVEGMMRKCNKVGQEW
jgi:hypothetical protein